MRRRPLAFLYPTRTRKPSATVEPLELLPSANPELGRFLQGLFRILSKSSILEMTNRRNLLQYTSRLCEIFHKVAILAKTVCEKRSTNVFRHNQRF